LDLVESLRKRAAGLPIMDFGKYKYMQARRRRRRARSRP